MSTERPPETATPEPAPEQITHDEPPETATPAGPPEKAVSQ